MVRPVTNSDNSKKVNGPRRRNQERSAFPAYCAATRASGPCRPSSPGARPSRDSQAGPKPRSGVISSTPPMSKTTAWMVMVTMMPLAPRARASGARAGWSELAEVAEQRVPDLGDLDRELQPDHGPVRPDRLPVHRDPAAGRLDDVGPDVSEHGHQGVFGALATARGGDVDPGSRLAVELAAAHRPVEEVLEAAGQRS